jgi:exodeoxyribonuclease X
VLTALFKRQFAKIRENYASDNEAILEMLAISSRPTLFKNFIFGKYKGQPISEVARIDRGYLEWLLAQKAQNEEAEEDWIYTLKHHLSQSAS